MLLRSTALALGAALLAAAVPATAPTARADAPAFDDGSWLPAAGGTRVLVHPFADAATLHVFDAGDAVLVIGTSGDFLRARLPDGRIGWILPEALADARWVALDRTVDVFPEPSARATRLTDVRSGERVLVLERDDSWARVVTGPGDVGWLVLGAPRDGVMDARPRSASRIAARPTVRARSGDAWLAVVATAAQLREAPTLDSDVVGEVRPDTRVSVVGEDGAWVRVVAPTASGWLPRHFLAVDEATPPSSAVAPVEPAERVVPARPMRARPTRPAASVEQSEEGWTHLDAAVRLYEQPSWESFSHALVREYRTFRALRARGPWLLLETSHGETGWAHRDALRPALPRGTPVPEPPAEPPAFEQRFRIVDVDVRGQEARAEARLVDLVEVSVPLTVRVGPSPDATPVVGLLPGDQITVIDHFDGWTRVELPRGRTGWVPSPLLGLPEEPAVVAAQPAATRPDAARRAPRDMSTDGHGGGSADARPSAPSEVRDSPAATARSLRIPTSVALHPEPSAASGELETLPGGAEVVVLETREEWLRVETDGARRGWLQARALGGRLHVLREPVVARRAPAWGARIVDDLDEGELVVVRQTFADWLEIRLPARSAWIPAAAAGPARR